MNIIPREIVRELDVEQPRAESSLEYKKYALCELSNGKPPVMTCKKEQREIEAVGIIGHGENRRCSLWNRFESCYKTLALDCRYTQAIWPGEGVLPRKEGT